MTTAPTALNLIIVGMGLVTYAIRLSLIGLLCGASIAKVFEADRIRRLSGGEWAGEPWG